MGSKAYVEAQDPQPDNRPILVSPCGCPPVAFRGEQGLCEAQKPILRTWQVLQSLRSGPHDIVEAADVQYLHTKRETI